MEIRNEIKLKKKDNDGKEEKKFVTRSLAEIQRAKLEKLMKNPDKPVVIPEGPKSKDLTNLAPSFVRNVMGSSAGAGSGEFHVYRNLRRKEYARLKAIEEKSHREQLNDDFQAKIDRNKQAAEEKTAKKRAKRLKKKEKQKNKKQKTDDKRSGGDSSDFDLNDLLEESDEEKKEVEEDNEPNSVVQTEDVKEVEGQEESSTTSQREKVKDN